MDCQGECGEAATESIIPAASMEEGNDGAAGRGRSVPHAVLVPWTGQGHLVPMTQLARILAGAGVHVTMVYSARGHARLRRAGSSEPTSIKVEIIPDGLPPDDLSFTPTYEDMLAAIPVMQQGLHDLLGRLTGGPGPRPTCLVSGTFCPWTAPPAAMFGLPRVELWSSLAIVYAIGFYNRKLAEEGYIPFQGNREETWISCVPGVTPMRASDYPRELLPSFGPDVDEEKMKKICDKIAQTYGQATNAYRVLVNSVYELEPGVFDALLADHVPAYAVGPLLLQELGSPTADAAPTLLQSSSNLYKEDYSCLEWLDRKDDASVVYVAFGSESRLKREDLLELALGLEDSQHNFLWVIRPGSVLDMAAARGSSFQDILPEGFVERTAQRGLVVSWAPQMRVLAHAATGAFLSHCGWNSTLETLCLGRVPIIAWPQRADQGIIKKLIDEDWQVGVSVKKDGEGRVLRAAIVKAVRDVMQGEEGSLARKASEISELLHMATLEGGISKMNLEAFIQDLYKLCQDNQADSDFESQSFMQLTGR